MIAINFKESFNLGQRIKHYAYGQIVHGLIIKLKEESMITEHEPVLYNGIHVNTTNFYWNQAQANSGFSGITPKIIEEINPESEEIDPEDLEATAEFYDKIKQDGKN